MRLRIFLALVIAVAAATFVVTTEAPVDDPVWWYTNDTPPRLSISGPGGPLRGVVEGTIALEPADRAHIVSISVDGRPGPSAERRVTIDSSQLPDGPHRVEVVARDTSRRQNEVSASWTFTSDNTPPHLDVRLDPPEAPVEGHTFVVHIQSDKPTFGLAGRLGSHPLWLQSDGDRSAWAVEGISPDPPSPDLNLQLTFADALGNAGTWEHTWSVKRTPFPEDDLTLDPGTIAAGARAEENSRLGAIYRSEAGPPQWAGPFRLPVDGPVTTEFGTHRSYEYHPGTDFAVPQGAPVAAPAPGTVVYEGELPARGNVLVLDHGAGVYSTYAHLEAFEVDPGAAVRAGQTIARVGTTGFSTGPHLHWELWVDGANVDPVDWTRRSFP
jgi:hypothetical protein